MKDQNRKTISGFSKLSKRGKIKWIVENFFKDPEIVMRELASYWHSNEDQQKILDGFSENTISNFPMPFGVAPNFLIDGKTYVVPMVIEESSVVAAASSAAKFWLDKGGFKTEILSTKKVGQVHFKWSGDKDWLFQSFPEIKKQIEKETGEITANMVKRGGGISSIQLLDFTNEKENYFQLFFEVETCDSMGANFINSILEKAGEVLINFVHENKKSEEQKNELELLMTILSNLTPDCIVRVSVECKIDQLGDQNGLSAKAFSKRFLDAIEIAHIDPYRATTHNKGIYNGVDAVVIATGNDFRAIEACGHAFASRDGKYKSLSQCTIENNVFKFWMDLPLAVGTVGGLTALHPIAKRSLELLGNPNANELMSIIAATGLAQNFAAVKSLVTIGIQAGHMKMHLQNILNQLEANEEEKEKVCSFFEDKVISVTAVRKFLESLRDQNPPGRNVLA